MLRRRTTQKHIACAEPLEARITLSAGLPDLQIDAGGRGLVTATGKAFFWMGDTAWELFHRLNRSEADTYLANRSSLKFNVVQAVAIAELDGFNSANAYGDQPFNNNDVGNPATTPGNNPADATQYDYWDHVDYIVEKAMSLGIYVAFLPTWGSHVVSGKFTTDSAQAYGQFLGARYAGKPIIWTLGGDRQAWGKEAIFRAMAKGIAIGATGGENYSQVLMTYHAPDGDSSSLYFHSDTWLDFNMFQSGHGARDLANYSLIERDWNKNPAKPTLDSEPRYENHPIGFSIANGRFNDHDVRQAAYWAVFAGGFGHTYGHHSIWQMHAPGRSGILSPSNYWYEAIHAPGADDMRHLRTLMESYDLIGRVSDQALVTNAYSGGDTVRATKGSGYALIYTPTGKPLTVNLSRIDSAQLVASWFNPRTGESTNIGNYTNSGQATFTPPSTGRPNDWVLVIADPDRPAVDPPEDPPEDPPVDPPEDPPVDPPPPHAVVDTLPPEVVRASWRLETPLPQLELTFSEDVSQSLGAGDIHLLNILSGLAVPAEHLAVTYDAEAHIATVRFVGYDRPLLPDGLYQVTLGHESITDGGGNSLAGSFDFQFRVRIADANSDGRIDIDDYVAIDVGYARRLTGFGNGDFNLDGVVDADDYLIIDAEFIAPYAPDLIPPTVVGATYIDDPVNPRVLLRFSEDVSASLSPDDFSVVNTSVHRIIYPWDMALTYASDTNTATLSFPGMYSLMLGTYRLEISGQHVTDAAGNNLADYAMGFEVQNSPPPDVEPPTITGIEFIDQTQSRLVISFSEGLSEVLGPWDLWLVNETMNFGIAGDVFAISYDPIARATTMTYAGGRLPAGEYLLYVWASAVSDLSGNALHDYYQFRFHVN